MIVVTIKRKSTMCDDEGWWKWVVVAAAFFVQFIICGITYSIGIFHVIFREIYESDHFDTSWAGSILLYSTALTSKYVILAINFSYYQYTLFGIWQYSSHRSVSTQLNWFLIEYPLAESSSLTTLSSSQVSDVIIYRSSGNNTITDCDWLDCGTFCHYTYSPSLLIAVCRLSTI